MDFKKTLLIICLFVGLNTVAQNRLEFNQVLTIDSNYTVTHGSSTGFVNYGDYYYVPTGKVWKILSYVVTGATQNRLEINDIEMFPQLHTSGGGGTLMVAVEPVHLPIWLKSGDKIRYKFINNSQNQNNNNTFYAKFFLSIIEFNIVTD